MEKKPIINFEGMQFRTDRRARLPRGKQWQIRRYSRSQVRFSRGLKNVLSQFMGR